jgi:hypothetical protein
VSWITVLQIAALMVLGTLLLDSLIQTWRKK